MQTFRRQSAAYAAAGDTDILQVKAVVNGRRQALYVTGLESLDEVSVLRKDQGEGFMKGSRQYGGYITMRHFANLGNGNWAMPQDDVKVTASVMTNAILALKALVEAVEPNEDCAQMPALAGAQALLAEIKALSEGAREYFGGGSKSTADIVKKALS